MTGWLRPRAKILVIIASLMVVLQLFNSATGNALNGWGVVPRDISSLPGILVAPWIHTGWSHLLNNLSGLVVLGSLVSLSSLKRFLVASCFIVIASGVLVWLLARPGMHIGASGWVFGLWGVLLGQAWFNRNVGNLVVALFVLAFYGGLVFGLLPRAALSFEYHVFGALCGVIFAAMSRTGSGTTLGIRWPIYR